MTGLLPEQAAQANAQRCRNRFRSEVQVATEAMLLMAIIKHACHLYPVRRDKVFALGISAGGAMALTLRYPERFRAVGTRCPRIACAACTAMPIT